MSSLFYHIILDTDKIKALKREKQALLSKLQAIDNKINNIVSHLHLEPVQSPIVNHQ